MSRDNDRDGVDRRNVLRGLGAAGTAGLVGLAGCTTEQADGGDGTDTETTTQADSGPDVVIVIGYPESGVQLFKDYYSDFANGTQFLVTDGLKAEDLPADVGNSMENVRGTAPAAAGPGSEFFTNQFEAEYGNAPGVFTAQAYDASACLLLANLLAGENDGTGVRDNLRAVANPGGEQFGPENLAEAVEAAAAGQNIDYVGASSAVGFDENGDAAAAVYDLFGFSSDGTTVEDQISFSAGSSIPEPEPAGSGSDSGRDDVRYGVLQPETGDLGSVGTPISQAGLLPATQLNGADTGFTFDARAADTQTQAQAGISAAESLVNAGYPGICGAASSTISIQVYQQVLIPNQVVGCSPASTSPRITNLEDDDYCYRTPPTDALQGQVLAQVASENIDATSASTMYVNNDYGQALSDVFVENFGGEVVAEVAFEKQQSSYTSKLSEALNA